MTAALLTIIRPKQWLKNLMLFFPPFFGGVLLTSFSYKTCVVPFLAFCLASSAMYVVNDVVDAENDRLHPKKRRRPIPAGKIHKPAASFFGIILLVASLILGAAVSLNFLLLQVAYLTVSLLYSFWLKHLVLLDVFSVAAGFLLRLLAGGVAFEVHVSDWLFLTVFQLALFLSIGKRLYEKQILGVEAHAHRPILAQYPANFLEGAMFMIGGAVLVTYTIYVISRPYLVYTVPLCCFGLFRFALLAREAKSGDPTESLLKDFQLFIVSLIWVVLVGWSVYGRN